MQAQIIIIIPKWFDREGTMRLAGKQKLGYFPLPLAEPNEFDVSCSFRFLDTQHWTPASATAALLR